MRLHPRRQHELLAQVRDALIHGEARPRRRQLDDVPIRIVGVDALEVNPLFIRQGKHRPHAGRCLEAKTMAHGVLDPPQALA